MNTFTNNLMDVNVIYLDNDGKYELTKIGDFAEMHAEETTTPNGVEPKLHIRDEMEIWTWGHQGNNPQMIEKCEDPVEAEIKLCSMQLEDVDGVEHYILESDEDLVEFITDLNKKMGFKNSM